MDVNCDSPHKTDVLEFLNFNLILNKRLRGFDVLLGHLIAS